MSSPGADLGDSWPELLRNPCVADLSLPWGVGSATRLGLHASRRRFYRLHEVTASRESGSLVLVVYDEPDAAEVERYQRTAAWLRDAGVRVPEVFAATAGALLVEDGGDALFAQDTANDAGLAYREAADILVAIQAHGAAAPPPNPQWALDVDRLRAELEFTAEHALGGWLGAPAPPSLADLFDRLAGAVAALPRAMCHRDFHSRNLLVSGDGLIVLDFQDLMEGPHLYDMASLLRDDYRAVPAAAADAALAHFWRQRETDFSISALAEVPATPAVLSPAARQSFCLTAAQRALKALGTFGYQVSVAGNDDYGAFGAATWAHARGALVELGWQDLADELAAFDRL